MAAYGSDESFDTAVDSYLYSRLICSTPPAQHDLLNQLSIGDVARLLERLGAIGLDGWARDFSASSNDRIRIERRLVGFKMSTDLGRYLRMALDKIVAEAPNGKGLIAKYGWVYRSWLGVPGAEQIRERLLPVMLSHAASHGIISPDEIGEFKSTVPLKVASATLGKGVSQTRRIVQIAGWNPTGSRPGVAFRISASEVERVNLHMARLLDCQTAAKLLNIGRAQFRQLVRLRLIQDDPEARRLGRGQLFCPRYLQKFLNELGLRAPLLECPPSNMMSLPIACQNQGVPLATACQAILQRKIKIGARGLRDNGIAAIKIDPSDIRSFKAIRPKPVATVAQALKIHPQAASELLTAGVFGVPPDVSAKSIAYFKREYAKPAELAEVEAVNGRMVIRRLTEAELKPSFGPPRCRQLFYRRKPAIAALALKNLPTMP